MNPSHAYGFTCLDCGRFVAMGHQRGTGFAHCARCGGDMRFTVTWEDRWAARIVLALACAAGIASLLLGWGRP